LKKHTLKFARVIKYIILDSFLIIFLAFLLLSQSNKTEKVSSSINELTPVYSIKKSFKDMDIIGFDILDKNMNRLKQSRFNFSQGDQFYVALYLSRNILRGVMPKENAIDYLVALYHHENGGYFRSIKTTYLTGEQETEVGPKYWQVGGIYKVKFSFNVPEFALPGKYILELRNERPTYAGEIIYLLDERKKQRNKFLS
jgi:hypothetical protein